MDNSNKSKKKISPVKDGLQLLEVWKSCTAECIAELRVKYLVYFENNDIGTSLPDVIRDCIWSLYSNRLSVSNNLINYNYWPVIKLN
jgi:hypothetical protein